MQKYITEEEISSLAKGDSWLTEVEECIILDIVFVRIENNQYIFFSREPDYPYEFTFPRNVLPEKVYRGIS